MSEAKFEALGNGRFRVIGAMTFETAVSLLRQSEQPFDQPELTIDFADVSETDSAGLALVIEWLKRAQSHSRSLQLENLPAQLVALARISEVDELLGIPAVEDNAQQPQRITASAG